MLGQWFERGLGQVVAPDPIAESSTHNDDSKDQNEEGGLLDFLAPEDPEYRIYRHSLHGGSDANTLEQMKVSIRQRKEQEETEEKEEKGLFDILAPEDPKRRRMRESIHGVDEGLWDLVAPEDPNYRRVRHSGGSVGSVRLPQSPAPITKMERDGKMVRCIHCYKLTPTAGTVPSNAVTAMATPTQTKNESPPDIIAITPSRRRPHPTTTQNQNNNNTNHQKLETQVLFAAKGTAKTLASPTPTWETIKNIFILCTATNLTEKKLKRLTKLLKKNDYEHLDARSVGMGHLLPDGFTPLHAAAYAGNIKVVQLFMEEFMDSGEGGKQLMELDARDLQGRTALHISAEKGHVDVVKLLKQAMTTSPNTISSHVNTTAPQKNSPMGPVGPDAPVDLTGRTPLAYAATSKEASKHRFEIENALFSPGDESVCGRQTPARDRGGGRRVGDGNSMTQLMNIEERVEVSKLEFGFAEMPGYRIEMEDALCCHYPLLLPHQSTTATNNSNDSTTPYDNLGLFAVFDGHGDGGLVSRYLADNLAAIVTSTTEYKSYSGGGVDGLARMFMSSCPKLDDLLKEQTFDRKDGGSTGVMALVSEEAIVVGNVGDSRCILVQFGCNDEGDDVQGLVKSVENLSVEEEKEKDENVTKEEKSIIITELSEDHKPNLPEERARIEKSGMLVMPEVFRDSNSSKEEDEDAYTTIWKIQRSEKDKIAVSRAFGDFDYKSNETLSSSEQAIVCTPDIRIHVRDETKDAFLILACDGIWDVMSNEEVGTFIWNNTRELLTCVNDDGDATMVEEEEENNGRIKTPVLRGSEEDLPSSRSPSHVLPIVGDKLIVECLRRGSRDNMTVLIISLSSGVVSAGISSRNSEEAEGGVKRVIDFAVE
uniref:PPM-type phosphatase domain-containing protein n=2 Tax=Ditylum brightwellii TaxID=49249 RepID=A0A7S4QHM4_9STRA